MQERWMHYFQLSIISLKIQCKGSSLKQGPRTQKFKLGFVSWYDLMPIETLFLWGFGWLHWTTLHS